MKEVRFNKEKDKWLKEIRRVSFDQVVKIIKENKVLGTIDNPTRKHQRFMLVRIANYVHVVPFIERKNYLFLKTIYPSRKYNKKYEKKTK